MVSQAIIAAAGEIRMKKKINPWENPQVYPSGVVSRLMISCIKNNS